MKCVLSLETHSDEQTRDAGKRIASLLPQAAVVVLTGELGAGKTTITKGIAAGRNAASEEDVSSPTFTLIHEYGHPVRIYHVDFYRLDNAEQARRLGLDDLFASNALVLLEWGNRFPELLPVDRFEIVLAHRADASDSREIKLLQYGS